MSCVALVLVAAALDHTACGYTTSPSYRAPPPAEPRAACDGVFFVYFLNDQKIHFALSRDGFHFTPLLNNSAIPGLDGDNDTSIRDPFVRWDPQSRLYRMVATDGYRFGHDATIWYWESSNLIDWTEQRALPVMAAYQGEFQDTWAPEWVWDVNKEEYVVFWTTRWLPGNGTGKFDPACTNDNLNRFSQWHTRTKDWRTFAQPSVLIDMHCNKTDYAPMQLGDGGYDCDIAYHDGLYHAYWKSMQAPSKQIGHTAWNDQNIQPWSGVHVVTSPDLKTWSTPLPATHDMDPEMLGMWGAEGPELLVVNETMMHLYFDCSFQPFDPKKWSRPPYGVAVARYPDGYHDVKSWETVPGSCTGNSTANMLFPPGATQGSFICVSNAQYTHLEAKWPP